MYHKIRITVVSLVVMTICMLSSTATLSYFTDTDGATNNFVVGYASTEMVTYNDAAGGDGNLFNASDYLLTDNLQIPFYLSAKNSGNIPVYQRFRVVIPIALAGVVTLNLPEMNDGCVVTTTSENSCSNADYTVTYKPSVDVENVPTYAEYYIVSNGVLGVGNTTSKWPTVGIQFGDVSSVDNSLFTCANNSNDCVLGISAYSDVVQTTGFTSVASAFANVAETY